MCDRNSRKVTRYYADEAEAMSDYNEASAESTGTTLGDLMKEQMDKLDK